MNVTENHSLCTLHVLQVSLSATAIGGNTTVTMVAAKYFESGSITTMDPSSIIEVNIIRMHIYGRHLVFLLLTVLEEPRNTSQASYFSFGELYVGMNICCCIYMVML